MMNIIFPIIAIVLGLIIGLVMYKKFYVQWSTCVMAGLIVAAVTYMIAWFLPQLTK